MAKTSWLEELRARKKERRERRLKNRFVGIVTGAITDLRDRGIEPTAEMIEAEVVERVEEEEDRPLLRALARLLDWMRESGLLELLIKSLLGGL